MCWLVISHWKIYKKLDRLQGSAGCPVVGFVAAGCCDVLHQGFLGTKDMSEAAQSSNVPFGEHAELVACMSRCG